MGEQIHEPVSNHHSIPDLEALLRTAMGDDLILENYTATNFLPFGENYGSSILKVEAVIKRRGKDSESEKLHMLAKTPPLTMMQRELFNSPESFKKEIFMYDTILPTYKKFELTCGINEEDISAVGPAFYGSRLNLAFGDDFDDNAVILMDNLKLRGYYLGSRYNGLDIEHSRVAVKAIARFHAIGIAIKTKNPDFFDVIKDKSRNLYEEDMDHMDEITKVMYRSIKEDPVMGEHYDACVKALEVGFAEKNSSKIDEPWSTIVHSDFWVNNILFHRNKESGLIDDIKFIDFQNYLCQSPLRELSFLLGALIDHEVSDKYIPELIDLYHQTLVCRLEMMGCDASPYSRAEFDKRLPKDAFLEFYPIAYMLKITTKAVDLHDSDPTNLINVLLQRGSDHFFARMRDFVTAFAKRGWLNHSCEKTN